MCVQQTAEVCTATCPGVLGGTLDDSAGEIGDTAEVDDLRGDHSAHGATASSVIAVSDDRRNYDQLERKVCVDDRHNHFVTIMLVNQVDVQHF